MSAINSSYQGAVTLLSSFNAAAAVADDIESSNDKLVDIARQLTAREQANRKGSDTISLSDAAKALLGGGSRALVTFNRSINFGQFTLTASGDGSTGSNKLTLSGPSGTFVDQVLDSPGGGGSEYSGGGGIPAGMAFSENKQGNKTYITLSGASATSSDVSLTAGGHTLAQSSTDATAGSITFVVDWTTGEISAEGVAAAASSTTTSLA